MNTKQDSARILSQVDDYYSSKIREHGPTPRGVDWNSAETQELRFQQLSRILPESHFSVGDLGCGYGGYYEFLAARHAHFAYTGMDISQEMIRQAVARHPPAQDRQFLCANRPTRPLDYVVASGIFNVRQDVGDAEWLKYIHDCLDTMNADSLRGFSFNCLTSYSDADRKRDYLYYADPADIFRHCMGYSRHVTLMHGYGLYEFTVLVEKDPKT